jgi:hypothetical protein
MEAEPSFAEKRRYPRLQLPVRCWMADGLHTVYARVHDVSLGGLSLRSPVPFAPDAEVELALGVFEVARTRAGFGRAIAEGI